MNFKLTNELNEKLAKSLELAYINGEKLGVAHFISQLQSDENYKNFFDEFQLLSVNSQPTKTTNKELDMDMHMALVNANDYITNNHLEMITTNIMLLMMINLNFIKFKNDKKVIEQLTNKANKESNQENSLIEKYCRNITLLDKENKLDPIIGREDEIRSIARILLRKTKNNPVLIGEPGVGKTAIIEGLAQKINSLEVPDDLKGFEVYELSLSSLLAGAKFQGEFEERMENLLKEIQSKDKLIIFIDEVHTLTNVGKGGGGVDAANMLKPIMARGQIKIIGATTLNEYRESIEKDSALERRFQKVIVSEPTISETITMLRGLRERFELHHQVSISDEAIVAAVKLSTRYITDRFLPDKAIDLIDEASAMIKMETNSKPESLAKLQTRISELEIEKQSLAKDNKIEEVKNIDQKLTDLKVTESMILTEWNQKKNARVELNDKKKLLDKLKVELESAKAVYDYEKAAILEHKEIPELMKQIDSLKEINAKLLSDEVINTEHIASIISKITKIPVNKLLAEDVEKTLNLENKLNEKVIGQEQACHLIYNTILRNKAGISNENRPIGSFLFLGPTGVGKTELAKTLAGELFDNERNLFRLDMSEFMDKHSTSKLIGSPPGYIGYDEGGKLTEFIRRNPYSIVLFDEIEKAHPDVLNILLQILDDGSLTDSKGRRVNFKNTIIIMTSNVGSKEILTSEEFDIDKILMSFFKPEFINRIDEIIKFNKLSNDVIDKIIAKELDSLGKRLLDNKNIILKYDEQVIKFVKDNAYNESYGARPLIKYIQRELECIVALHIIKNSDIQEIDLTIKENQVTIK